MALITSTPTRLFDTTVFIHHLQGHTPAASLLIQECGRGLYSAAFSIITESELWAGVRNEQERRLHTQLLMGFQRLPVHRTIARRAGQLRLQYRSKNLQLGDSLVAATAEYYKLPVYTANVKDFAFITTIRVETY